MIRLFIGLALPDKVKDQVMALDKNLVGALWKGAEKLHLLLSFIGNIEEPQAEELMHELRFIRFPAFHLSLKEIGYFETGGIPHHLWVGVEESKALHELQEKIEAVVHKLGLDGQNKFKFHPHVMVAKLQGTTMSDVMSYISANNLFHSDLFLADSFCMFSSHAKEAGEGKYYKIETQYPLMLV